jgi:molybdenum cofactor synthesis domain-containing protein
MTVSDTRTRENDTSGDTLESRIKEAGHHVADRTIVPDDQDRIVEQLLAWIADPEIDVIISTGGTGLTGRDVTPEAFRSVFEKEIDGFSAIFTDQLREDRDLDNSVARLRRSREGYLPIRAPRLARCRQGRLGPHPESPARLPALAVQFHRDHARLEEHLRRK